MMDRIGYETTQTVHYFQIDGSRSMTPAALLSALLLGAADGRLLAALLAALPAASAVGTGALRWESRKDTPPTATQTTRVSPAMRRMARLRLRRRISARVRRRRWMGCC